MTWYGGKCGCCSTNCSRVMLHCNDRVYCHTAEPYDTVSGQGHKFSLLTTNQSQTGNINFESHLTAADFTIDDPFDYDDVSKLWHGEYTLKGSAPSSVNAFGIDLDIGVDVKCIDSILNSRWGFEIDIPELGMTNYQCPFGHGYIYPKTDPLAGDAWHELPAILPTWSNSCPAGAGRGDMDRFNGTTSELIGEGVQEILTEFDLEIILQEYTGTPGAKTFTGNTQTLGPYNVQLLSNWYGITSNYKAYGWEAAEVTENLTISLGDSGPSSLTFTPRVWLALEYTSDRISFDYGGLAATFAESGGFNGSWDQQHFQVPKWRRTDHLFVLIANDSGKTVAAKIIGKPPTSKTFVDVNEVTQAQFNGFPEVDMCATLSDDAAADFNSGDDGRWSDVNNFVFQNSRLETDYQSGNSSIARRVYRRKIGFTDPAQMPAGMTYSIEFQEQATTDPMNWNINFIPFGQNNGNLGLRVSAGTLSLIHAWQSFDLATLGNYVVGEWHRISGTVTFDSILKLCSSGSYLPEVRVDATGQLENLDSGGSVSVSASDLTVKFRRCPTITRDTSGNEITRGEMAIAVSSFSNMGGFGPGLGGSGGINPPNFYFDNLTHSWT